MKKLHIIKSQSKLAWTTEEYKLYSSNKGKTFALYHLPSDIHEDKDLSAQYSETVEAMKKALFEWEKSCSYSDEGGDY